MPTTSSGPPSRSAVDRVDGRQATRATYVAFAGSGFAFASWAARIPQVRDDLALSSASLGLVLLAIAAGSVTALPLSGVLVARFGSRRTVQVMAVLLGAALVGIATGYHLGVVALVVALYLLGFANGAWDVAMNVQGALVEQCLGRSIMSRFHAGYSLGTVAGALTSAGLVWLDVSVTVHLSVVGVAVAAIVISEVRGFVPDLQPDETPGADPTIGVRTAWREPRTLLIGLFVLAFAFAEGAGNDWINVAMIDGYDVAESIGVLAFAAFLAAMTIGRWFGPGLLERYGRVAVVRVLAAVGVVGSLVFVFGASVPVAFAGALLWGIGVSLGFPVGMSAGADEPRAAPARVSVIASIGYCSFLGGPPLVGFLGAHGTVLKALIAVSVLLAVATMLATSVREPEPSRR